MPINIKHVKLIKAVAGTHAATSNRTATQAYDDIVIGLTNSTHTNATGMFDYLTPLRNASVKLDSVNFLRTREESFDKSFLNSTICASRTLMQLDFTPIQTLNKLLDLSDDQIQQVPASLKVMNDLRSNLRSLVVDETNTVATAIETLMNIDKTSVFYLKDSQPWHLLNLISPAYLDELREKVREHQEMGEGQIYIASIRAPQAMSSTANPLLETSFITSAGISTGGFDSTFLPALTGRGFDLTSKLDPVAVLLLLLIAATIGTIGYTAQRFFKSKVDGQTFVPMDVTSSVGTKEEEKSYSSMCCYVKRTNI
jgi:hypothetical protein